MGGGELGGRGRDWVWERVSGDGEERMEGGKSGMCAWGIYVCVLSFDAALVILWNKEIESFYEGLFYDILMSILNVVFVYQHSPSCRRMCLTSPMMLLPFLSSTIEIIHSSCFFRTVKTIQSCT